jgi:hypothetical protein
MCLVFQLIVLFIVVRHCQNEIYLWNTQDGLSVEYYDCAFVESVSYCRRPEQPMDLFRDDEQSSCGDIGRKHRFSELKSHNISLNTVLHEWRSSIEKVESYARYLRLPDESDGYLCQCLHMSSFGKHCEYQLPMKSQLDQILHWQLAMKRNNTEQVQIHGDTVCYMSLQCNSGLLCLDWREICDGIEQCMPGIDEYYCDRLELNLCDDDEYRCMNGMCIPDEYFLDGQYDCLDWSDEIQFKNDAYCSNEAASIICDDRMCPPNHWSCGDGQCIPDRLSFQRETENASCQSKRDQFFLCETHISQIMWSMPNGRCQNGRQSNESFVNNMTTNSTCQFSLKCALSQGAHMNCPCWNDNQCSYLVDRYCHEQFIQYPEGAIIAPYLFFIYNRTRDWSVYRADWILINGTGQCRDTSIEITQMIPFNMDVNVQQILENVFCQRTMNVSLLKSMPSSRQMYHSNRSIDLCEGWKSYMSITRVKDGWFNCLNRNDENNHIAIEHTCSHVRRHRFRCSNEQRTCLSVTKLANQRTDCDNRFDELWLGAHMKLSDINCDNEWQYGCAILRHYITQSWTSTDTNDIDPAFQIPFRSYCDTFWNLHSKEDENLIECRKHWICTSDQWQCQSGQCIELTWLSDNEWDCADASDEWNVFHMSIKQIQQVPSMQMNNYSLAIDERTCNETHSFLCLPSHVARQAQSCISNKQIGDSHIDCVGAIDERNTFEHCQQPSMLGYYFKCVSDNTCISYMIHCRDDSRCPNRTDDEQWCNRLPSSAPCREAHDMVCFDGNCIKNGRCDGIVQCQLGEDEYMCDHISTAKRMIIPYRKEKQSSIRYKMKILHLLPFPSNASISQYDSNSDMNTTRSTNNDLHHVSSSSPSSPSSSSSSSSLLPYWCNRGIGISTVNDSIVCFCPPQYYGNKCQYQTDRLLVLIHLDLSQVIDHIRTDEAYVLKLLVSFWFENQTLMITESHVRPASDAMAIRKKLAHFLYPHSSIFNQKRHYQSYTTNSSYAYSVRIELYDKQKDDRASLMAVWKYPIDFAYLPVYRLAKVLRLVMVTNEPNPCSSHPCHHNAECRQLMNERSRYVCLCKSNFTGDNCSILDRTCIDGYCAPNALCMPNYRLLLRGNLHPHCICPFNRFGDRCEIEHKSCRNDSCQNGGTCVTTARPDRVACLCTRQYRGKECEKRKPEMQLFLSNNLEYAAAVVQYFGIGMILLDLVLVHQEVYERLPSLIYDRNNDTRTSHMILAKIYTSHWPTTPNYYLLSLFLNDASFNATVGISDNNRCPNIRELMNGII